MDPLIGSVQFGSEHTTDDRHAFGGTGSKVIGPRGDDSDAEFLAVALAGKRLDFGVKISVVLNGHGDGLYNSTFVIRVFDVSYMLLVRGLVCRIVGARMIGGQAKNPEFRKRKSDVMGKVLGLAHSRLIILTLILLIA